MNDKEAEALEQAASYYKDGNFEKAAEYFTTAIKKNKKNAAAYLGRGTCYKMLKKYEHAVVDLGQAMKLDPDCSDAYVHKCDIYRLTGKLGVWKKTFEESVRLDKDNKWAKNHLIAIKNIEEEEKKKKGAAAKVKEEPKKTKSEQEANSGAVEE